MKPLFLVALLFLIVNAPSRTASQNEDAKVEIKVAHLSGSVRMLTAKDSANGGSVNMAFSSGTDGTLLVDTLLDSWAERIRPALRDVSAGAIKFIINTHWHTDHIGGNDLFGRESVIIAHPNVRKRLMTEQTVPWQKTPLSPQPPHALPVVTFDQTASIHFNGEEIRLIHFPNSHTDGDTVVYFTGSKVVCMGDTVFMVAGALMASPGMWNGGDAESLARNLEELISQLPPDVKVVPGHGRLMTLNDLKAYNRILTGTIDFVRQRMAAGKKPDEMKAEGLPRELESLGDWKLPEEQWIEVVYKSLTEKQGSGVGGQEAGVRSRGSGVSAGSDGDPVDSNFLVLNRADNEAVLLDGSTHEVIASLATGREPHEVAASPDGRYAYAANYRSASVTVLDLKQRKVKDTFELGSYSSPHSIRVSRDGSRLWVTAEDQQAVLELDAESGKILKAWKTDQQMSHMLAATPDDRKIYVANIDSGTVSAIDRANDQVKTISVGAGAEGVDVSPDGREVWVANRDDNTISVIEVKSDRVVATFSCGGNFPVKLRFNPTGREVWVSNNRSGSVAIFDAKDRKQIGTVDLGTAPLGLMFAPDGRLAFVTTPRKDGGVVIDVATRKVLKEFRSGGNPDGMEWSG